MTDHICSDHLHCSLGHQPSVNRMLWELGHFDEVGADGFSGHHPAYEEIETLVGGHGRRRDAVASWQSFRPWLKADGVFGEVSHMASVQELGCRCGLPDLMRRPGQIAEWPPSCQDVSTAYDLDSLRTEFEAGETIDKAWLYAIERWNEVCGIVLSVVGMDDDPRISATAKRMGAGVLADSYLANGSCASRLTQRYNTSMTWDWHQAWGVMCHEMGHALGWGHTGAAGNIMQPFFDRRVTKLGTWDIEQAKKRYGPPVQPPPDDPPVEPPTPGQVKPNGGIVAMSDGREFDMFFRPRATT